MFDSYKIHAVGNGVDFHMVIDRLDIEDFIEIMTKNGVAVTILKGVTNEEE